MTDKWQNWHASGFGYGDVLAWCTAPYSDTQCKPSVRQRLEVPCSVADSVSIQCQFGADSEVVQRLSRRCTVEVQWMSSISPTDGRCKCSGDSL